MPAIIFRFILVWVGICLVCAVGYWISKRSVRKTRQSRLIHSPRRAIVFQLFSLDATEILTLWHGGYAEVRRRYRVCDSLLTRQTEGAWEFDEHFGRCRINVDGRVTEYLLVTPHRSFNHILVAGGLVSANL